ncbi:hypothetical protein EF910_05510 [Streptomyces sp. WAC07149]|uniref:hypothetical protein n=1 Tax=Streptomyces sp. WAC07149 TaxID=2487425 RepID=UPI000F7B685B|nr:hypothetical protein [Streptomyces sp. WAC07149]RST07894.1 hypothetical protein EF910_05510 [Streptomyces sp. WAC07149]
MTEIVIEEGWDVDSGTFREFWVDVDRHGLRSTLSIEQASEAIHVKWYVDPVQQGPSIEAEFGMDLTDHQAGRLVTAIERARGAARAHA